MTVLDALNYGSDAWARFMFERMWESTLAFLFVSLLWAVIRKWTSPQFGYWLFLLVLFKLFLPIHVTLPEGSPDLSINHLTRGYSEFAWMDQRIQPFETQPARVESTQSTLGGLEARDDKTSTPEIAQDAPVKPISSSVKLTWQSMIALIWLLIVMAMMVRYGLNQFRMVKHLRSCRAMEPSKIPIDLKALCQIAGLRRTVQVYSSPVYSAPFVWRFHNPCLIVPQDFFASFSASQARWILLHELAHIRRGDLWITFVQTIAQILFFFHPVVWIVNRIVDQQREYICDDIALAQSGAPREDCGEGFLSIIERVRRVPRLVSAPLGLIDNNTHVRRRMMRILDEKRKLHMRLSMNSLASLLALSLLILPVVYSSENSNSDLNTNSILTQDQPSSDRPIANKKDEVGIANSIISTIERRIQVEDFTAVTISPDGEKIAGITDNSELAILNLESGKLQSLGKFLFNRSRQFRSIMWSPDNKKVAINHYNEKNEKVISIVTLNAGENKIFLDKTDLIAEDWSPFSNYLLCTDFKNNKNENISLVNLETCDVIILCKTSQEWKVTPRFSPTGKYFIHEREGLNEKTGQREDLLVIRNIDGSIRDEFGTIWNESKGLSLKKDIYGGVTCPLWTGCDNYILFGVSTPPTLWAINVVDGYFKGSPFIIKSAPGNMDLQGGISTNNRLMYEIWYNDGIYAIQIDSQTKKQLSSSFKVSNDAMGSHTWTPDGSHIVQNRFGEFSYYPMNPSYKEKNFTCNEYIQFGVGQCFSTDGSFIISAGKSADGTEGIYKVEMSTGDVDLVVNVDSGYYCQPFLGSDDNTVVYWNKGNINKINLDKSIPIQLTNRATIGDVEKSYINPSLSKDCQRLFCIEELTNKKTDKFETRIISLTLDGQDMKILIEKKENDKEKNIFYSNLCISPSGNHILYVIRKYDKQNKQYQPEVIIQNLKTMEEIKIDMPKNLNNINHLRWSPNEDFISFHPYMDHNQNQFWIMENFLPSE